MTKVPLYPISCQLTSPDGNIVVSILKIAHSGIMVDSLTVPMKVNTKYTATFTFSPTGVHVDIPVTVYKTYDEHKGHTKPGHHLNELVYHKPSVEARKIVASILGYISAYSV